MENFKFIVEENQIGMRLDKFLAEQFLAIKPEVTRSKIQHFIEEGVISDVTGKAFDSSSHKVKLGEEITVTMPAPRATHLTAKEIPFEIIFEDDDLLVINKPSGLTVHPGTGNQDDTLVNALLFTHQNKLSSINGEFRPGIVHRLDKDTSGLMLVAKNDFTHQVLSQKLKDRDIKRAYLAFVYGVVSPANGVINKNIVRSRQNRLKMSISRTLGRNAVTNYETKEIFFGGFASMLECRLDTGRTHQIRVHLEHEKHSLLGDQLYNSCRKTAPIDMTKEVRDFITNFPRQALHSYKIGFIHPRSEKEMSFEIPLPDDLIKLVKYLKNE
jgi:23S rRNA pseudouridine1911/1915/1917 synthase